MRDFIRRTWRYGAAAVLIALCVVMMLPYFPSSSANPQPVTQAALPSPTVAPIFSQQSAATVLPTLQPTPEKTPQPTPKPTPAPIDAGIYTVTAPNGAKLYDHPVDGLLKSVPVESGELVEVLKGNMEYALIDSPVLEKAGYVKTELLSPGVVLTEETTAPGQTWQINFKNGYAALYAERSHTADVLAKLYHGYRVSVLDYSGVFAKVSRNGVTGYVIASYLEKQGVQDYQSQLQIVNPVESYTYEQMVFDLKTLEALYPELMKLTSIGQSEQGRELYCAVVGEENAEHQVFVQASIHAREHMTTTLAMAQLETLLQAGGVQDVCFHIVPMSNPDGVTLSQQAQMSPLAKEAHAYDLKNKFTGYKKEASYLATWKANANGVDLNRNFDVNWEKLENREQPSMERYNGAQAADQKETQALVSYTQQHSFDAALSYHCSGSLIYYTQVSDRTVTKQNRSLAQTIGAGTDYPIFARTLDSGCGYTDWASETLGIPAVTIEFGSQTAPLKIGEFPSLWARCQNLLFDAANWAIAQSSDSK